MSLFSSDGINFSEASSFSSISSLHQRNRDRHDHHDGTATVEHCHLWEVQLTVEEGVGGEDGTGYKDGNFEAYVLAMRKVCGRKKVHFS